MRRQEEPSVQVRWILPLLSILLLAALLLTACQAAGPASSTGGDVVKIGGTLDQTGPYAMYGQVEMNTIKMVEQEIKDAGGFKVGGKNYTFQVLYRDIRGDPSVAATEANALIKDDGVKSMRGGIAANGLTIAEIAKANNVMYFSAASPVLEKVGQPGYDLILPAASDTAFRSAGAAEAVHGLLPNAKTIVWVMPDDPNTPAFENAFMAKASELGITRLDDIRFPANTTDFSSFLTKAKALKADIVGIGTGDGPGAPVAKAADELGVAPYIVGWNVTYDAVKKAAGRDLKVPYIWMNVTTDVQHPITEGEKKFTEKYKAFTKTTDLPANIYAASWHYDMMYMLAEAMTKAGTTTDVKAIKDAMVSMKYDKGLLYPVVQYDSKTHKLDLPSSSTMYENGKSTGVYVRVPGGKSQLIKQ